ncbi:PAS domain-containing sensor histidine kinase [Burkholderiaceae bacterium UC74_6]
MGSLSQRLFAMLFLSVLTALGMHAALTLWPVPQLLLWMGWPRPPEWATFALSLLFTLPLLLLLVQGFLGPLTRLLRALEGAVLSYREGDFSMSIAAPTRGTSLELGELMRLHGELGQALREQRRHLAQRELLLDTVVQNTPVALVLTDAQDRVAIANIAARQLLAGGRSVAGTTLTALIEHAPAALRDALMAGEDGMVTLALEGAEETFHLTQREIRLQGLPHRLRLIRRMTRELSRQEVASWKRVIRVISHELNNSLAPISSLAHSGRELLTRGDTERLARVFDAIGERATHLHGFIDGYARFAKLPAPRLEPVQWSGFLQGLAAHAQFQLEGEAPVLEASFDAAQIEQALINLLKNAHEAGGAADEVRLRIEAGGGELRFTVFDRGPGMSETVLSQALLPFYSTKRSGTGLGLALAREISEAHGGRVALENRAAGGLAVSLVLPRVVPDPRMRPNS